jgi:prevent-host-death family protein
MADSLEANGVKRQKGKRYNSYCPRSALEKPMRTISSGEMQKNFGSVLDRVVAGESVRITRRGRPAFLLIPDTGDGEDILRELAARKLTHMLRQAQPTPAAQTLTQQDINRLIDEDGK